MNGGNYKLNPLYFCIYFDIWDWLADNFLSKIILINEKILASREIICTIVTRIFLRILGKIFFLFNLIPYLKKSCFRFVNESIYLFYWYLIGYYSLFIKIDTLSKRVCLNWCHIWHTNVSKKTNNIKFIYFIRFLCLF